MSLQVVAFADGAEVWRGELPHGADPDQLLRSHGWDPQQLAAASAAPGGWELRYRVTPAPIPEPYQRPAAYALVVAPYDGQNCVLLTSFINTSRDGYWGLPGGGIDAGEEPADAAVREVMEETGQQIVELAPLGVVSNHWVGRSPAGRWEDFHAVRMVYSARCPDPVAPVVHDIGGTTAEARWVSRAESERLPILGWARGLVAAAWEPVSDRPD